MKRVLSNVSRAFALLLAGLGSGCTSSVAPEGCAQNVNLAVTPAANPLFSWSPACGVSSLSVARVPSQPGGVGELVWGFSVSEQTPIGPPIRYGASPAGARIWTPPRALEAGATYRVQVVMTVGGDVLVSTGERDFTR